MKKILDRCLILCPSIIHFCRDIVPLILINEYDAFLKRDYKLSINIPPPIEPIQSNNSIQISTPTSSPYTPIPTPTSISTPIDKSSKKRKNNEEFKLLIEDLKSVSIYNYCFYYYFLNILLFSI